MKAEDLKKELAVRLEVEEWINSTLLPDFVKSAGEPVGYSISNSIYNDKGPLSNAGQKYLESLGYKLTINIKEYGRCFSDMERSEAQLIIALP
jgi:hypothetical protein